jgi:Uma2 family endonuclease
MALALAASDFFASGDEYRLFMSTVLTEPWTLTDFLAWERKQDRPYEWDGVNVIAMTGGSFRHGAVVGNIYASLHRQAGERCRAFVENIKVATATSVRYPDVLLICDATIDWDGDVTNAATLIVEVLSPSTHHVDLGEKLAEYATVTGLHMYIVADPLAKSLRVYRRDGDALIADEAPTRSVALPFGGALTAVEAFA